MPTESGKPLIVIGYALGDEPERPAEGEVKWLSFVTGYLKPAIKHGAVDLWLDRLIPGSDWQLVMEQKLRACDIFILLVSRNSLSSYVTDNQIKIIRERQARGETVHFYPLLLTPTHKHWLDLIRDQNLRPRDGKPFSEFSVNERCRQMSDAMDEIAKIAGDIAMRNRATADTGSPSARAEAPQDQQPDITDEASLLLWLMDQSPEVAIAIASRTELRISPLVVHAAQGQPVPNVQHIVSQLASTVFRVGALARVAAKYPERTSELVKAVGPAMGVAVAVAQTAGHSGVALGAIKTAIASATAISGEAKPSALSAVNAALDATVGLSAMPVVWAEIRADAIAAQSLRAGALVDLPLWSGRTPKWAEIALGDLQALLPDDEGWDVWIEWYEQRLRGKSRGENYELIFANVPPEEWDKGPRAANAWIRDHLPLQRDHATKPGAIRDRASLESWLLGQTPEVAIAIAARAALRAVPLAARATTREQVGNLTSVVLRATAMSWFGAHYQSRNDEFRPSFVADTQAALTAAGRAASQLSDTASANAFAASAAALGAAAAHAAANTFASHKALASDAAAVTAADAVAAAEFASQAIAFYADSNSSDATFAWDEVRADAEASERTSNKTQAVQPLWSMGIPNWAKVAWSTLKSALPTNEDWEVWIDWYEERLRGGSRSKDYELIFASVPREEWEKGPAAANAWIKARLPRSDEDALKDVASLKQQAALYSFRRLADGRIAIAPEEAKPEDQEATRDFLDESRRKAAELRERLFCVQADTRLQRTLTLLDDRLAPPIEAIRVGLVLSSLRSLESDVRAYNTEEGHKEHALDLIAGLDDLAGTVRDFVSQFPRSREIVANQVALELVEDARALDAAIQASESLAVAAESHPELIDRNAPEALREPKESAEGARTTADRAKLVGLRLLTAANFGRIVAQTREVAVASWNEVRKQVPKAAGKAAANVVLAGPGLAFGLWAGHSGLALLLDTAGAIAAINGAVGHPGGAFDRILNTIEKVAAKKPVAETQKQAAENKSPKRKAEKKAGAKRVTVRRKPLRRAPQKRGG